MSSAQARLAAVSGALSASYPQGLLKDEVAIITGVSGDGSGHAGGLDIHLYVAEQPADH